MIIILLLVIIVLQLYIIGAIYLFIKLYFEDKSDTFIKTLDAMKVSTNAIIELINRKE